MPGSAPVPVLWPGTGDVTTCRLLGLLEMPLPPLAGVEEGEEEAELTVARVEDPWPVLEAPAAAEGGLTLLLRAGSLATASRAAWAASLSES